MGRDRPIDQWVGCPDERGTSSKGKRGEPRLSASPRTATQRCSSLSRAAANSSIADASALPIAACRRTRIITKGSGRWAGYSNIPGARALSLAEAVALVERVRASAARGAREALDALAVAVPVPITSIALRACPELPPTIEERIADNRAQTVADSVMYREALATAAAARGWSVQWYRPRTCVSCRGGGARPSGHRGLAVRHGPLGRPPLAGEAQACGGRGAGGHSVPRTALLNDDLS